MIRPVQAIDCALLCVTTLCVLGCQPKQPGSPLPANSSATSAKSVTTKQSLPSVPESIQESHTTSSAVASVSATDVSGSEPAWFDEVTAQTGVSFSFRSGRNAGEFAIIESLGGGLAAFDYDRDGRIDLHFAGGGTLDNRTVASRPCGLFRNLGPWQFADATRNAAAGASEFYSHGIFPGDWNNDGFEDVAISGYGGVQLLQNQGDGTFLQLASLVTHPDHPWSSSLAWADFDEDGVLDLYVAHYVDWSWTKHPVCPGINVDREVCAPREFAGVSDAIYFGNGEGSFRRMDDEAGLVEGGKGLGVVTADVDSDGDTDIYVANDTVDNFYYINDGQGHFHESAVLSGVAGDEAGVSTGSMGTSVFDADSDGLPDIWAVNFERELFALYRNEGSGLFSHVSRAMGLGAIEGTYVGFGTVPIDYDHDGDLDVVVSNGHVSYASPYAPYKQLPLLLENDKGRFKKVAVRGYFAQPHTGRGLAYADFDNDGVLDLAVSHLEEPVAILRGNSHTEQKPVTRVHLVGIASNRNALGAVLRTAKGRLVMHNGGGSYLSSSESRLWLTDINTDEPLKLQVAWPSGQQEEFVLTHAADEHWVYEGQSTSNRQPVP